ncbi:hypothetical protein ES705_33305 [subsurface metagenome]
MKFISVLLFIISLQVQSESLVEIGRTRIEYGRESNRIGADIGEGE